MRSRIHRGRQALRSALERRRAERAADEGAGGHTPVTLRAGSAP